MFATLARLVLVVFLSVVLFGESAFSRAPKESDGLKAVRALKLSPRAVPFGKRGKRGVRTLSSPEALAEDLGEKAAKEVADQIDFDKQQVAVVNWTTGGPPFGKLSHQSKKTDKGAVLQFFVKSPVPAGGVQPRGSALKLGFDLFAIPKDVRVELLPGER